jgi:hypothetical protein
MPDDAPPFVERECDRLFELMGEVKGAAADSDPRDVESAERVLGHLDQIVALFGRDSPPSGGASPGGPRLR